MILDFTAKKIADTIESFNNPNKALFIYGHTGKGKTYSALKYCMVRLPGFFSFVTVK